jgi:hypothetical protein
MYVQAHLLSLLEALLLVDQPPQDPPPENKLAVAT